MNSGQYRKGKTGAVLALVFAGLLTGCGKPQEPQEEITYYSMAVTELTVSNKRINEDEIPRFVLRENGEFFWDYRPFEEAEMSGSYTQEEDVLTARSEDGTYQWQFEVSEHPKTLTLIAESAAPGAELIENAYVREEFTGGAVFEKEFEADTKAEKDGSVAILTPYRFPETSAANLADLSDKERKESLQIPEEELEELTDRMLLETILDYPYGGTGGDIEAFAEQFNGAEEFITRRGAGAALLELYRDVEAEDMIKAGEETYSRLLNRLWDLEEWIAYLGNKDFLSDTQKELFEEEIGKKGDSSSLYYRRADNEGGSPDKVFMKKIYMGGELGSMLEVDFDTCTATIVRDLASSTIALLESDSPPYEFEATVGDDCLTLTGEDLEGNSYEYIFRIDGGILVFDRKSSSVPDTESMKDGTIFK